MTIMPSPFARRAARARRRRSRDSANIQTSRASDGGELDAPAGALAVGRAGGRALPISRRRSAPTRCMIRRANEADPLPLPPYVVTTAISRDNQSAIVAATHDFPPPAAPENTTQRPPPPSGQGLFV